MRYFDRSARLRRRALRELALVIIGSVLAAAMLAAIEAHALLGAIQPQGASPPSCGAAAGASGSATV